jgi:TRAP-type C4-dicarboxylate transport system substrate-binding protein
MYPAGDTSTIAHGVPLVNALNEKLAGKLHITLYMPGDIVPEDQMFDALSKGVYDAALTSATWSTGVMPAGVVAFGMPLGWQNYDQVFEFFNKYGFLKFMRDLSAEHNVYYVAPLPEGALPIQSNFAFQKADDIKGKKIWAKGSNEAYIKALGGTPVSMPFSEIYMALKLGTIDGAMTTTSDLEFMGRKEVTKYVNWPSPINPLCIEFITNLDAWKALPADVQKTIEDTVAELQPLMYQNYLFNDEIGLKKFREYGGQEITIDPSELPKLRAAALQVWNEIAAQDAKSAEAIKMLKDYLTAKGITME